MAAFFRFLSKRRSRRTQHRTEIGQALDKKKNVLTCTIMLLDGTDLTVDIPVCLTCIIKLSVFYLLWCLSFPVLNIYPAPVTFWHWSRQMLPEQVWGGCFGARIQFYVCCGFYLGGETVDYSIDCTSAVFITVYSVLRHAERRFGSAWMSVLLANKVSGQYFRWALNRHFVYTC